MWNDYKHVRSTLSFFILVEERLQAPAPLLADRCCTSCAQEPPPLQEPQEQRANIHTSLSICRKPVKLFLAFTQTERGGYWSTTPCFTDQSFFPLCQIYLVLHCNAGKTSSFLNVQQKNSGAPEAWFILLLSDHWFICIAAASALLYEENGKWLCYQGIDMFHTHMHASGPRGVFLYIIYYLTPHSQRNLLQHSLHSVQGNVFNTTHTEYI